MKAISPCIRWAMSPAAYLLCLGYCSFAMSQAPDTAQPVHTNKSRFRIPFRYDAAEIQRIGAKEIRLYLSMDQGKNWTLSRQASPQAGKFDFEATTPGEYWFAVRTLDGRNQLYPATNGLSPGLKVIVDDTPPTLTVELAEPQAGKVSMSWQASDPYLDLSTLRLEYIQPGSDHWELVSVVPQANGQTAWSVPQGGIVAVRGQIFDQAGNIQQTQTEIRLKPADGTPNLSDPIASSKLNQSLVESPTESSEPPSSANPFAGHSSTPADYPSAPALNPPAKDQLISNSPAAAPKILSNPVDPQATTKLPPKISKHTRVVNSRRFQIGYKVDDVGPSGVGDVELFITEDDGDKWYRYGNDSDRTSPFQVETPRDGIYGFALRVHSGAGLAADPPKSGEKPAIVVVVDNTPPSVQLLSADQGRGKDLNRVVIRWLVADDYPAETPVALSYTADPGGVWEPISGWISDSGEYVWNAGPNAPTRLFFRVTARDAAGNLNRSQTLDPVIVDLSRPSARIVDVESIETEVVPRR